MFYVSAYFEARRGAYYDGLLAVSRDNDWTGWCRFFLEAIQSQAQDNLSKARGILALYEEMKRRVPEMTRSQYAWRPPQQERRLAAARCRCGAFCSRKYTVTAICAACSKVLGLRRE